jgi:hypothetical protein
VPDLPELARFSRGAAAEHVAALVHEGELRVVTTPRSDRARASRRAKIVALPEVRSLRSYLVCLHEIGHVLGPNPPKRLDQEVAAWHWALVHSRWEPTPACWAMIGRALGSYVARAVARRNMAVPSEAHPIWPLVPVDRREVIEIEDTSPDPRRAAWLVWCLVRERVRDPSWSRG